MGSCQLWLPRGQAHVESSLPSGLVPRQQARCEGFFAITEVKIQLAGSIGLPSGLVPMEAAIGSYKSLNESIIILLALALRSARRGGSSASKRDRWLNWFLHAHEYEPEALLALFPEAEMQLATITLARITEITEDKTMVDAREKALRDQQWALNAAHREGEIKGEIKLIRTLEGILGLALSNVEDLQKRDLADLQSRTSNLQDRARNRA